MPKNKDQRRSFSQEFKRIYNSTGNNASETARIYGISPQKALQWLDKISQGDYNFIKPEQVQEYRQNRAESDKFFIGRESMEQVHEITGPNWHMIDYVVEAGKSLPDNEHTRNAQMFQLIINGRENGKSSNRTTSVSGDLETLFMLAAAMMRQYGKFAGSEMIVRVFSPAEE